MNRFKNKDKKLWNKNKEIGETFYGWFKHMKSKHMKRVGGKRGYCTADCLLLCVYVT